MWIVTCNPRGTFSQYAHSFNKREEAERLYDLFVADGLPCTLCMAIESANGSETEDSQPLEVMGRKRFEQEMDKMADYYGCTTNSHSSRLTPKSMV